MKVWTVPHFTRRSGRNKRVQTSIYAKIGFNNSERETTATNLVGNMNARLGVWRLNRQVY